MLLLNILRANIPSEVTLSEQMPEIFLASIDTINDTNKIPVSHKAIVNSLARILADDRTAHYVFILDQCRVSGMTNTT